MKKTIVLLMLMTIISGVSLTACGKASVEQTVPVVQDTTSVNEEQMESVETENAEKSEPFVTTPAPTPVSTPAVPKDQPQASTTITEPTVTVKYADGTYSASGGYSAPSGQENIVVNLTVKDEVVTAVNVTGSSSNPAANNYIGKFIAGVNGLVVGKKLDEIGGYSAVNGASLTPTGFDVALASIKGKAKK